MSPEFDLISRHFARPPARADVILGAGRDDAALLRVPPGQELVVSMDTLVEGVHFLPDADPSALGHKALAVNLSDLAAMGAEPAWATLALTLPAPDDGWLARFCEGFGALAREFGVDLVGGDTTRGPLAITVQAHGFVPPGAAFRRDAARPGDLVYVTGTLGDAGLALILARAGDAIACPPAPRARLAARLDRPVPRVREALRLRGLARAAIDISDGLYADLGHILHASGVGATIEAPELPLSAALRACVDTWSAEWTRWLDPPMRADAATAGRLRSGLALAAGDDYELCFTAPPGRAAAVEATLDDAGCAWARIGTVHSGAGLRCLLADGSEYVPGRAGYDQFDGAGGGEGP